MSNSITGRLGMAYFSTLWLVVTFPVLLILSVTAMVSYGRARIAEKDSVRRGPSG